MAELPEFVQMASHSMTGCPNGGDPTTIYIHWDDPPSITITTSKTLDEKSHPNVLPLPQHALVLVHS